MKALITKFFKKEKQKKEISTFKAARRALITSIVSLVVCFSILSGTTFAWFTDSVTSGKNKIEAGYTDFEVYKYVSGTTGGSYTGEVKADSTVFSKGETDAGWEPGEVRVAYYKIKNTGNLDIILNVDLVAKAKEATENQQETVKDLSDYMVLKAVISNTDFVENKEPTTDEQKAALKAALKAEAGFNVGGKTFKTNLFPAENPDSEEKEVVEPNDEVYVKVIGYLPNFNETTESKPLIFSDKYNELISGAKCDFSMTVNAFQVIEDTNITYKTFLWVNNTQDSANSEHKLALQQVPATKQVPDTSGDNTSGNNTIKVWKEVNSSSDTLYAFDQDSLQAALSIKEANIVVLNDIFVTSWTTIDEFSGTIKSYQNRYTIWGLNNRMIDTFNGKIENLVFKNCKAPEPYEVITNQDDKKIDLYNGILAAKAGEKAEIKRVDVLYSTIGILDTKENYIIEHPYRGALIGWAHKDMKLDEGITDENLKSKALNNSPTNNGLIGYQVPKQTQE